MPFLISASEMERPMFLVVPIGLPYMAMESIDQTRTENGNITIKKSLER